MEPWMGFIAAIMGGGGALAVLVGRLVPARTSREARITNLETQMANHTTVINAQADYIGLLRKHIVDGKPPPPPPYPDGLTIR